MPKMAIFLAFQKKCNDAVFSLGDVLEVFIGPVVEATDDCKFYHELDTSSSGVLWASQIFNARGNVSNCNSQTCTPGLLGPCYGKASFPFGLNAKVTRNASAGFWKVRLIIPFAIFKEKFLNRSKSPPHNIWRLNFYRYDFPLSKCQRERWMG